jgi:hypothetical protein
VAAVEVGQIQSGREEGGDLQARLLGDGVVVDFQESDGGIEESGSQVREAVETEIVVLQRQGEETRALQNGLQIGDTIATHVAEASVEVKKIREGEGLGKVPEARRVDVVVLDVETGERGGGDDMSGGRKRDSVLGFWFRKGG